MEAALGETRRRRDRTGDGLLRCLVAIRSDEADVVENHRDSRTHNSSALKGLAEGIIALTEPQRQCGMYSEDWEHYDETTGHAAMLVDLAAWQVNGSAEQARQFGAIFMQSQTNDPHWHHCNTSVSMRLWFVNAFRRQFPINKHAAASHGDPPAPTHTPRNVLQDAKKEPTQR